MESIKTLKAVLVLISAYHILLGLMAFLSGQLAAAIAATLFGMKIDATPQLSYIAKILGVYALMFGIFMGIAARDPIKYKTIIYAAVFVYAVRLFNRLVSMNQISETFDIPAFYTWMEIGLLIIFGGALLLLVPKKELLQAKSG